MLKRPPNIENRFCNPHNDGGIVPHNTPIRRDKNFEVPRPRPLEHFSFSGVDANAIYSNADNCLIRIP